jgi:hypothetical protein
MIETSLFTPTDNALPLCSFKLDFNLRSGRVADLLLKPAEQHANKKDRVLSVWLAANRLALLSFLCLLQAVGQANSGSLHLWVADSAGHGVRTSVHISSEASQYRSIVETDSQGHLDLRNLPYGTYQLQIQLQGFAPFSDSVVIRTTMLTRYRVQLKLPTVNQTLTVTSASTLLDPEQPGSVNRIGSEFIEHRITSIPGRSLQDLVNSQPGWLYEGNAVLHPRGSEYQTQFVVDGIPLTDNRSPSFGPEIEADDVGSLSIYTAGIPAEYGRKMGGVVEVNTITDAKPGMHGQVVLSGGSFDTAGLFAKGRYAWGHNAMGGSADGAVTARFLNPVVPQNYSNTGTSGGLSVSYQHDFSPNDQLGINARHERADFDIPNEQVQESAGQRQTANNVETAGVIFYQHQFSDNTFGDLRGMVRDNANDFYSNAESTPIALSQHNWFREGYFRGTITAAHRQQEWKLGVESDNTFLHENFHYQITDLTQFDPGTLPVFSFAAERPDLEQSAFVQDLVQVGNWIASLGVRWDHYQVLLNKNAVGPRVSISRYIPSAELVMHFSYDRVFQTPSSQNLLLSSSSEVESINPEHFFRLPVQPSEGNFYEGGLAKTFFDRIRLDTNYYRRDENSFADDDQIENTTISFPIAFRKAIIYGAEAKLDVPEWGRWSGFLSYSYMVGNAWFPVTGGLFLGSSAAAAETDVNGHFPVTQDQRNTVRGRTRFQIHPRVWVAGGFQYDSGLPFEFDGDPATALAEYGPEVLARVNFARGRIYPSFLLNASAGVKVYKSDRVDMQLQADGQNLTDLLDVIDFGGLFSGNAIGPSRSLMVRLTTSF